MVNSFYQLFSNRFKIRAIFYALCVLFLPSVVLSNVTNLTITSISNTNPAAGTNITITVTYDEANNTQPFWRVGITPAANINLVCPSATNQYFLVDSNTPNPGTSPVVATQQDTTDSGNGWGGINTGAGGPQPYTQIFTVTIPAALSGGGAYNIVVQENDNDVQCNTNPFSGTFVSQGIMIQLPATNCTLAAVAESTTVAPSGLILFNLNYSFVNTTSFTLTDQMPANTTVYSMSPGGTLSAGTVTWTPYSGAAAATITGTAWILLSVNPAVTSGMVIMDSATGTTSSTTCNSSANSTVVIPQITPVKTESATSLVAGSAVSYTLDFTATGNNLQYYDSYDNVLPIGTSDTAGGTVDWGYDLTPYQNFLGPSAPAPAGTSYGTWTIDSTDAAGDHFIEATVPYYQPGSHNNYPELIRNDPGAEICDSITVEGDLQIPVTAAGAATGADAHMVIACNTSQGITLKAGISIDNSPGNLFIQKNNIYPLQSASASTNFTTPFSIMAGQWYTMEATVQSNGTGTTTFNIQLWQTGNPGSVVTLNYTDTFAPQPTCSGGWRAGWQADETAGTDWYSNLKVFGPGPFVNAAVTDVVPQYVTYVGSNLPDTTSGSNPETLAWNSPSSFPATIYSFDTPVSWWGTVGCPGPINNQFTMGANSIPAVTSNLVTLNVMCNSPTNTATSSATNTPTATPTNTVTNTPTATATNTATLTPVITSTFTNTPTNTVTQTPTNTPTITPTATVTSTPTNTNTPVPTATWTPSPTATPGLYAWPNPFNPKFGNGNFMVGFVPPNTTVDFYTVSGELVQEFTSLSSGTIEWPGTNKFFIPVSTGIYIYIVKNNGQVLLSGKVFLVRN